MYDLAHSSCQVFSGAGTNSMKGVCMQGNCNEDTTKNSKILDVHTAQLKPGQCMLLTSTSTFNVATSFWLDNIYIMQRPGKIPLQKGVIPTMIIVSAEGKLWATDVTVEGDRANSKEGMRVEKGGQAFLDGVPLFHQFLCHLKPVSYTHLTLPTKA